MVKGGFVIVYGAIVSRGLLLRLRSGHSLAYGPRATSDKHSRVSVEGKHHNRQVNRGLCRRRLQRSRRCLIESLLKSCYNHAVAGTCRVLPHPESLFAYRPGQIFSWCGRLTVRSCENVSEGTASV